MTIPTALAAVAQDGHQAANIAVVVGIIALILTPLVFFLAALISVLGSPLTGGMKLVWVVFAFCAPFLGPLLWFLVGRRSAFAGAYR
ncbi:PLD nuclease N-terminal domain-containing protein [Amycolatopsis rhabdoformis]|uniref:PLD nuclease N-terminal domain-containing protein n=1 Tax=Amycolatopsis rhabdoformis TaxID=1448059 RepID=A0ABZ1HVU3_9PSEU|nr:PLD nuclease N-terminal domain-containing protein [Amycolatopsis rhabdoformis]WSE26392.1 PLD nuclease N-terminal domain-containing protein [Amycolatopsis rhabdoformis]